MPSQRTTRRAVLVKRFESESHLTLRELSDRTGLSASQLIEMVEEGLLQPQGRVPSRWRFPEPDALRVLTALRLQRDLGVNLPGAVLVIELMDELRQLRSRVERLRFHLRQD